MKFFSFIVSLIVLVSMTVHAAETLQFAFGMPQIMQLGVESQYSSEVRPFVSLGFFKYSFSQTLERTVNSLSLDIGVRWHPVGEKFFFSGALGYRRIGLSVDMSAFKIEDQTIATNASAKVQTLYFAPALCWNWYQGESMTLGSDLGAHIPVLGWGSMIFEDQMSGLDSGSSSVLKSDSDRAISRVAKILLPQLTLIRMSWAL